MMVLRIFALVAVALWSSAALSQTISVQTEALPMGESWTYSLTPSQALNDISGPIDTCSGMFLIFDQSSTAQVALYAVGPESDTAAEVLSGTLLSSFMASTPTPVTVSPGTLHVRFIVTMPETSGESIFEVRCMNVVGSTYTTAPPPAGGSSNWDTMIWDTDVWG